MKVMLDSNVFDRLPEFIDIFKKGQKDIEYYITTVQIDELCEIKDDKVETRKNRILMLAILRPTLVPISVFALNGRAYLGYARLGEGEVFKKMLTGNDKDIDDAIIADTAVYEHCTLITDDKRLYNRMKRNNYDVMTIDEFIAFLGKNETIIEEADNECNYGNSNH